MRALKTHWPEYLMEAAELAAFMFAACVATAALEYPASPLRAAIPNADVRRVMTGVAMGLTALAIIQSPWGRRSGAHFNPSVTLAFLWLGKVHGRDALFYVLAQFGGGLAGVLAAQALIGPPLGHADVRFAVTTPGPRGAAVAFAAELLISFGMMAAVLASSNSKRFARLTPVLAATLVAVFISVEAPLSGMSMNPARTLGSAAPAGIWTSLWIYFAAPVAGMLLAARLHLGWTGGRRVICAKLHHHNHQRCIFRCGYGGM